ncbi:MAG: hypothetical protein R6U17_00120, partial [Thermoplasmata archaeon]
GDIDTIADTTSAETTITMDDDYSITAVFETDLEEFDLTIVIQGEGTTDPEAGTHTYIEGTSVTVTATAADGWEFEEWTDDASGTGASTTVTMNEDMTITAVFAEEGDDDGGSSDAGFLEDYWWLLLLLIIVILAIAFLMMRGKKEVLVEEDVEEEDYMEEVPEEDEV